MFTTLILVCALGQEPRDCQPETAISVTRGPDSENELICGLHGQAYIASTEIRPGPGEWLKIMCRRSKNVPPNLG